MGLHFACTSPDKHPTTLAPPLLAAMLFRQSEIRQGQDFRTANTKTWETFSSAAVCLRLLRTTGILYRSVHSLLDRRPMAQPTVYLETTVIGYATARPSRDLVVAAHQQITREWLAHGPQEYELFVSQLVIR